MSLEEFFKEFLVKYPTGIGGQGCLEQFLRSSLEEIWKDKLTAQTNIEEFLKELSKEVP